MPYWTRFNEKNLSEYQKRFNWNGDGTETNPLIIDNIGDLNLCIRFKNISSYLIFKNLTLCEFMLKYCENIRIENCKIFYLDLGFCHDITIVNSAIMALGFESSRGNSVRNTKINIYYLNGILRENREKIDIPSKFYHYIYSFFASFFLIISIFTAIPNMFLFTFVCLFLSSISLFMMLNFKVRSLKIMKSPPNQFENIIDEDEVFDYLYKRFGTKYSI